MSADAREIRERLRAAAKKLPREVFLTLVLAYAEGLNVAEIGAALDVPPATVEESLQVIRDFAKRIIAEANPHYDPLQRNYLMRRRQS